jgi:hypothetical protein
MAEIWSFLTQPENRAVLSWLGGGLVVICGGLWAALKFSLGRRGSAGGEAGGPSPASRVSAGHGGIAGGRDVRIDNRSGLQAGPLILLVLAIIGALLIVVSQAGNRVAVSNGVGVGGDVRNSTITNQ